MSGNWNLELCVNYQTFLSGNQDFYVSITGQKCLVIDIQFLGINYWTLLSGNQYILVSSTRHFCPVSDTPLNLINTSGNRIRHLGVLISGNLLYEVLLYEDVGSVVPQYTATEKPDIETDGYTVVPLKPAIHFGRYKSKTIMLAKWMAGMRDGCVRVPGIINAKFHTSHTGQPVWEIPLFGWITRRPVMKVAGYQIMPTSCLIIQPWFWAAGCQSRQSSESLLSVIQYPVINISGYYCISLNIDSFPK